MVYNQCIHVCVPTHVYTDIHRNIFKILHTNLGQMLRMGGGSRFTSWLVWYQRPHPQAAPVSAGSAVSRQHKRPRSRYFIVHLAWKASLNRNALMCYTTDRYSRQGWAAESEDCWSKHQKVQNTGAGSVTYRSEQRSPPTGSSFVAASCLFSLTLYSFSTLLYSSPLTEEWIILLAHVSGHHHVPHRAISRQLNFNCRTAITENNTFLENTNLWKHLGSWVRITTLITV